MIEIKGILEFDPINVSKKHGVQSSWKKVAMIRFGGEDHLYYSWLIKRRFGLSLDIPLRGTHLTVISDIVDDLAYLEARSIFGGKEIMVLFDPTNIASNKKGHWWMQAECAEAMRIRESIGLSPVPYFGMHITIGRANQRHIEHSEYISRHLAALKYGGQSI